MWIDDALNEAALKAPGKISFFCSYGHSQIYCEGDSEETKLRRERDLLKQDAARLEMIAQQATARADKAQKETKRLKRRSAAGACPCCKRLFSNMREHMRRQHPTFVAESATKVVPIKVASQ